VTTLKMDTLTKTRCCTDMDELEFEELLLPSDDDPYTDEPLDVGDQDNRVILVCGMKLGALARRTYVPYQRPFEVITPEWFDKHMSADGPRGPQKVRE